MPPVFAAVGAGLAGLFGATVTTVTIGETVILTAASIGLGFVEKALVGKPKIPSIASQQSQQITSRQAVAPWPVIYGRSRIGGIFTYISVTGTKGEFLNLVITVAGHQVHSIDEMFFDGVQVADASGVITGSYSGFITILQKNLGTSSQPAFPGLVSADPAWTSTSKQSGRAGVYVQLKYSADKFPNSVPNITFNVKGKEVFDPRSSTTGYSENPALCIRDYLTTGNGATVTQYGLGCASSEINDPAFISAANSCDDTIALKSGGHLSGGGNQRYLCNGSFTVDQKPVDILNQLLSSMAGYLTWNGGKWSVFAGVWRGPATVTLTDDDLRGAVKIQLLASKSELANRITGTIMNAAPGGVPTWKPMDFAPYCEDSAHGFASDQWLIQDNNERIDQQIQLPFTIDAQMAQRLAKIQLERIRRQIRATWPCKISAYAIQPADVIQITRSRYGWVNKTFEVTQAVLSLEPDDQGAPLPAVDLSLRETDASVYAWNPATEEQADTAPGSVTLPNPSSVGAPSSLILSTVQTTRADGILATMLHVAWTAPTDQMVLSGGKIAVLFAVHGSGNFQTADIVDPSVTQLDIKGVSEGTAYDVEIYSISVSGATSAIVQSLNFTVAKSVSNYSYRPLSNPLTATDAGASDTVSIAAFTNRVGGNDISISSGAITSLSRSTLYFIYYSDTNLAGGSVTFTATTTKETALQSNGRFFIGSIVTPPAGGSQTIGNNDGGAGAQDGTLFIMSPQMVNDTTTTSGFVPMASSALAQDADGDTSTAIDYGSVGTRIVTSFPQFSRAWKTLTLKVLTSLTGAGGGTVTVSYSLDGGATFTTIWTVSGSGGRALTTDSVTLPVTQNTNIIQVKYQAATLPPSHFKLFETWIEGIQ